MHGKTAEIVGWYADIARHDAGAGVELVIHDMGLSRQWSVALDSRRPRKDVANALGDSVGMLGTGFAVPLNLSGLPVGHYGIYLRDSSGDDSVCGLGRGFVLR